MAQDYQYGGYGVPPPSPGQGSALSSKLSGTANPSDATKIDEKGTVMISFIVGDLETPFAAVRDTVRFLSSLYPKWSLPSFAGGNSLANEVGATYKLEKYDTKEIAEFDSTERSVQMRRRKTITIAEILDNPGFKVISYKVLSKLDSDLFQEVFSPTTYILVEIKEYPYQQGKYQFTATFDGGPPDVEATYCCGCISNPSTLKLQEDAQEMRPKIYTQAKSVMKYIRGFDPHSALAQQIKGINDHNALVKSSSDSYGQYGYGESNSKLSSQGPMYKKSFGQHSAVNSQFSNQSPRPQNNGYNYSQPPATPLPNPYHQAGAHTRRNNSKPNLDLGLGPSGSIIGGAGMGTATPPGMFDGISRQGSKLQLPQVHGYHGATTTSVATVSNADEIQKLFELYKQGALTKSEFESEKKKLLAKGKDMF